MKGLIFHPISSFLPRNSLYSGKITSKGFIFLKMKESEKNEKLEGVWSYFEKETAEDISPSFLSAFIKELIELFPIEEVLIGMVIGNKMYLAKQGEIVCFLSRGEKFGPIFIEGNLSYGKIQTEDKLFISSKEIAQSIGKSVIEHMLKSEDFGKNMEGILLTITEGKEENLPVSDPIREPIPNTKTKRKLFKTFLPSKEGISHIFSRWKGNVFLTDSQKEADPKKIRKKKVLFISSLILTLILVASLFVTIRETRNKQREKILNTTLITVKDQYDEAANLVDLNPPRARELLASAKLEINPLLNQFPKDSDEYKKAQDWVLKLSDEEALAYKIYKLSTVPLFFDITFIKSEGEGNVISVFENTAAILDTKNQVIYILTLDKKQASLIAGSSTVKDAKGVAIYGKNVYIANSDGLVSINIATQKSTVVSPHDDKWGDITAVSAYGANIYLLDNSKNMIWKYTGAEQGFNPIDTYLSSDTHEDFSKAFSMVIDGDVWVVTDKGIYKFTRGVPQSFTYKEFSDSITSYGGLSAVEENNNLYILDKLLSRIVVFNKEGTYQAQYQWENLKNASALYANEKDKKIYVVVGSKIYAIDMK